jgi:hypothetical protein
MNGFGMGDARGAEERKGFMGAVGCLERSVSRLRRLKTRGAPAAAASLVTASIVLVGLTLVSSAAAASPPPPVPTKASPLPPGTFDWSAYANRYKQEEAAGFSVSPRFAGPAQMGLPAHAPSPIKVLPDGSVVMPPLPPRESQGGSVNGHALSPPDAYGLGGDSCTTVVNGSQHFCSDQSSAWTGLRNGLPLSYVRFIVPWDTVGTFNSSTGCVYNQNSSGQWNETYGGNTWVAMLIDFLDAANTNGLIPVIALGNGNGVGSFNGVQEPVWPHADGTYGLGSTGDSQYVCALYEMGNLMRAFNIPISYYETYNEPDSNAGDASCNAWCVGGNYYLDAYYATRALLSRNDFLIAGAFNFSSVDNSCCTWVDGYLAHVWSGVIHYGWPAPGAVSGHPYNDTTFGIGANPGTHNLVNQTNSWFSGEPIWLTETGVWLNDPTPYDATTYGEIDDGEALNQAEGAADFKALTSVSQVKVAFWYEFETNSATQSCSGDSYDSALLGIANGECTHTGLYNPGAGEYGVPRPSLCVLAYGDSPSGATTDSRCDLALSPQNPLTDWQDPGGPGNPPG